MFKPLKDIQALVWLREMHSIKNGTFHSFACFFISLFLGLTVYEKMVRSYLKPHEGVNNNKNIWKRNTADMSMEYLTKCMDRLYQSKRSNRSDWKIHILKPPESHNKMNSSMLPPDSLHFVFIGDSRIRQLFFLFLERIPQFDLISIPFYKLPYRWNKVHEDVIIYSKMLRLVVAFHWRPFLVDKNGHDVEELFTYFLKTTTSYLEGRQSTVVNYTMVNLRPDFILAGIAAHHMMPKVPLEKEYFEKLKVLRPLLKELSEQTEMLWFDQYPLWEAPGSIDSPNTRIHSRKIWFYNSMAKQILSGIEVFDDGTPWVMEYLRGCLMNERIDKWPNGYLTCEDYIHPGTNVLSEIVQIYITAKICCDDGLK